MPLRLTAAVGLCGFRYRRDKGLTSPTTGRAMRFVGPSAFGEDLLWRLENCDGVGCGCAATKAMPLPMVMVTSDRRHLGFMNAAARALVGNACDRVSRSIGLRHHLARAKMVGTCADGAGAPCCNDDHSRCRPSPNRPSRWYSLPHGDDGNRGSRGGRALQPSIR